MATGWLAATALGSRLSGLKSRKKEITCPVTPVKIIESGLDGWHGLVRFMCASWDQYLIPEEGSVPSGLGLVRIHSLHSSAQHGPALTTPHGRRAGEE